MTIKLTVSLALFLSLACHGRSPQFPPFPPSPSVLQLTMSTVNVGDIDGDGHEDYAIGDTHEFDQAGGLWGAVRVMSSATGAPLNIFRGGPNYNAFSTSLASGDFDGDGVLDLVIAAGGNQNGPGLPRIDIYNPATSLFIASIPAPGVTGFGARFAFRIDMQDMNGDGMDEIITCSEYRNLGVGVRVVDVFAGGSGALLFSRSRQADTGFGERALALDDINGDGHGDLLIVSRTVAALPNSVAGVLAAYDPLTGNVIHSRLGPHSDAFIGSAATIIDDRDGDGLRDIVISSRRSVPGESNIVVLSSASGAVLSSQSVSAGVFWIPFIKVIDDLDGDGVRDFGIGAGSTVGLNSNQHLDLYSSATGRKLDRLDLRLNSGLQFKDVTVMPDLSSDGYGDILLPEYFLHVYPGVARRLTLAPVLPDYADGNHPTGKELLTVNGDRWAPSRRLDLSIGEPFFIDFGSDDSVSGLTNFIIFGMVGLPTPAHIFPSYLGDFLFPPSPVVPGSTTFFTLADSVSYDPAAWIPTIPAPFHLPVVAGIGVAGHFALQGVSITNNGLDIAISNAVLLQVK